MGKLQVHAIVIFVILFGILAWFIALGGLAAATFECTSAEHGDEGAEAKLAASYVPCAKTYQWEWFQLWFELALLVALFVTCFLEQAFKRGRMAFLAFFVLATQGLMWSAHNFLTLIELGPVNLRDVGQDAVNAGAAGFVLLSLTNFVLLIVLGKDVGYEAQHNNPYREAKASGIAFQSSAPV